MRTISLGKLFGRIFFFCFFVVAIYLSAQLLMMTKPSYNYETVISYQYADSVTANGYVLFEETVVEGSGELGYLVEEGNRISAGQAVAEQYVNDAQQNARTALEQTNAEIALLQASENTSGMRVDNLVTQRSTAVYQLIEQLEQGDYKSTQQSEEAFLLAQNKLQVITGDQSDFSDRIAMLTTQSESLLQSLGTPETINSPSNGYFVSKNSAKFLTHTLDELSALSVADFADQLTVDTTRNTENIAGKVVSSYTWYFMAVCSAEDAARFKVGGLLDLAFPDKTDTVFPATVVSVEEDAESGLVRVTLQCEYIGVDALSLGQETAQIIFKTYDGLRVPADAVRMIEVPTTQDAGQEFIKGVYVAYNGVAKFRKIEALYQMGDYILVPLEGKSEKSQVRLYDQIIISSTDLTDGKLL